MSNNNRYRKKKPQVQDNYVPPFPDELINVSVETLTFRQENTLTLLKNAKYEDISSVVKREEKDFYKILTFNKKNLVDLVGALRSKGLYLKPTPPKPETAAPDAEERQKPAREAQPPKEGGENRRREGKPRQQASNVTADENGQDVQRQREPRKPVEQRQRGGRDRQDSRDGRPRSDGRPVGGNEGRANGGNEGRGNDRRDRQRDQKRTDDRRDRAKDEQKKGPERPPKTKVVVPVDIYVKIGKGDKWGFSDRTGKIVVQPIYDEVYGYKEDVCCVEKDGLVGYINREGEEIIPAVYELGFSFSEGYACVFKNDKCGYINLQGEEVVPFKYDAGTAVEEGGCRVKKDGRWGELRMDTPTEVRWII